jgi:hypothetical protein
MLSGRVQASDLRGSAAISAQQSGMGQGEGHWESTPGKRVPCLGLNSGSHQGDLAFSSLGGGRQEGEAAALEGRFPFPECLSCDTPQDCRFARPHA